jgi:predicted nucleic acid-binding protein
MYLLDTNIVSYWMRGDEKLIAKIKSHKPSELSICTITLAEINYGIEKSPIKKKNAAIKFNAFIRNWKYMLLMNLLLLNTQLSERSLKKTIC